MTKKVRSPKIVSGEGYCRKCQKTMPLSKFYEATNPQIDTNGFMSVCRECCADIYDMYFSLYNNFEIALKLTCQDLDVRFSEDALKQTQSHIEKLLSQGKKADKVFGYYKSKLGSTGKNNEKLDSLRFKDSEFEKIINNEVSDDIDDDLILFWGKGFDSIDDYIFLETELGNWKQTHKCDNQAEITLLREICIKILEIRKAREIKDSTSNLQKELQELMKTASVDPAKANVASAGKSQDAWGVWVKDIEQFRPAEWHDQQEKYKDMDGLIAYIKDYIIRPIKNFVTGQRDFQISDGTNVSLEDEDGDLSNG